MRKYEKAYLNNYTYKRGPIFLQGWQLYNPEGDCTTFAINLAYADAGGMWNLVKKMFLRQTKFCLMRSPVNKTLPRHLVLWVKGRGYIDSTRRGWREETFPHKKVMTLPFIWCLSRIGMGRIGI